MLRFHLIAFLLCVIWNLSKGETESLRNPKDYLTDTCSMENNVGRDVRNVEGKCLLLRNIRTYIDANLINNFQGLKLKRDFAADLATDVLTKRQRSGHVKYMSASNIPNFQKDHYEDLKRALDERRHAANDIEMEMSPRNEEFQPLSTKDKDDIINKLTFDEIRRWLALVKKARKPFLNENIVDFLDQFRDILSISDEVMKDNLLTSSPLSLQDSLVAMGLTDNFLKLFWPFRLDIAKMNQKLGLYGVTKNNIEEDFRSQFFRAFEAVQAVQAPYEKDKIVFSFDHPDLVDGMNRSKLVVFSKNFVENKMHIFSESERAPIIKKTNKALDLIKDISPELYKSLVQLVSCFAFYKTENPKYLGGSTSSALGVIWLDPSAGEEWTIPFYAEMIVHEFIHTHLFYVELVHGSYSDGELLSKAKVVSSIRGQSRDYDKSFHAAYISAGLATFHSRAGYLERAEQLSNTLKVSVDSLNNVNTETGVLDESGNAMLKFLVDYVKLMRI